MSTGRNQKYYVAYRVNNYNWIAVITTPSVLRLDFLVKAGSFKAEVLEWLRALPYTCVDCDTLRTDPLMEQAAAAIDRTLSELSPGEGNVVDARGRFVAGGGRWKPTPALRKLVTEAALGRMRCPSV